jgi:hypothetical protein
MFKRLYCKEDLNSQIVTVPPTNLLLSLRNKKQKSSFGRHLVDTIHFVQQHSPTKYFEVVLLLVCLFAWKKISKPV